MERAEKQTELAIANERQRGLRAGTANMITEKISENTDGASGRSALSSETSYLESPGQVPHRPGQQHRRPGNPAILKKPPPPPRRRSP